jgi:hypothetical protein
MRRRQSLCRLRTFPPASTGSSRSSLASRCSTLTPGEDGSPGSDGQSIARGLALPDLALRPRETSAFTSPSTQIHGTWPSGSSAAYSRARFSAGGRASRQSSITLKVVRCSLRARPSIPSSARTSSDASGSCSMRSPRSVSRYARHSICVRNFRYAATAGHRHCQPTQQLGDSVSDFVIGHGTPSTAGHVGHIRETLVDVASFPRSERSDTNSPSARNSLSPRCDQHSATSPRQKAGVHNSRPVSFVYDVVENEQDSRDISVRVLRASHGIAHLCRRFFRRKVVLNSQEAAHGRHLRYKFDRLNGRKNRPPGYASAYWCP